MKLFWKFQVILIVTFMGWSLPLTAKTIKVITSFSILADMARNVGRHHVTVTSLVGINGDAHIYEPKPTNIKALRDADVFIVNGLGFEGWINRLIESSGYRKTVVLATQGIVPLSGLSHEEGGEDHGIFDPHAWHDLENGLIYVDNIAEALKRVDPMNKEDYEQFSTQYQSKIKDLHKWVQEELNSIPKTKRKAITTHDSFRYFENAYGITFYAPLGWNTDSEPSAGDVANMIRQMRQDQVRVVFLENITDSRLIQQISKDANGVIGGTLFSDALSKESESANTYLNLIRHNTQIIKRSLDSQ